MLSEFLRILIALLLLHMQHIRGSGHGPFRFVPHRNPTVVAVTDPTPTATVAAQLSETPVATSTETPAPTSTLAPSATATSSPIPPSATPSQTIEPSPSPSPTLTPTPPPTSTSTALPTATWTETPVPPTSSPTAAATDTPRPTATATSSATATSAQSLDPVGSEVTGIPPAQKLPSAVLIYPLVRSSATQDTRIEMLNLLGGALGASVSVECFYVSSGTCNELGFLVSLTPNQPLSWMASSGLSGNGKHVAPPFAGDGELKCVVMPPTGATDPSSHNALQGRALISDSTGQTIGYSAIAFRRLSPGSFTGEISLDGINYEQCPDRLHFNVLTNQSGSDSILVLVPCSEDLVTQQASGANVQIAVINEMEQRFSGATRVTCFNRLNFSSLFALRKSAVGTDTAHLIIRGTDVPVVGLVVDRFTTGSGQLSTSGNEPDLEGGRSATVALP